MTPEAHFHQAFGAAVAALPVVVSDAQRTQLFRHYERLLTANAQFNLTRITEPADAAVKLYADSLAPLAWVRTANARITRVLDVGTGGGFPAVPLAVGMPAWKVVALDSTGKKTRFLESSASEIGLRNLQVVHARAGEWKHPQPFQLVLFKAVGTIARCLQCVRGLVARDGFAVVFKGRNLSREELEAGQAQAEILGMQTWDTFDYELPLREETLAHTLVIYRRM